jgi:glycosylphosphatidylinositol transamidase (GPIT) subunit GPI8
MARKKGSESIKDIKAFFPQDRNIATNVKKHLIIIKGKIKKIYFFSCAYPACDS